MTGVDGHGQSVPNYPEGRVGTPLSPVDPLLIYYCRKSMLDPADKARFFFWNIDLYMLPAAAIIYSFCFIDRSNTGNNPILSSKQQRTTSDLKSILD